MCFRPKSLLIVPYINKYLFVYYHTTINYYSVVHDVNTILFENLTKPQKELLEKVSRLIKDPTVSKLVDEQVKAFRKVHNSDNHTWFSELCFCLLTANSSATLGIKIQNALQSDGFINLPFEELQQKLKQLGHRFYTKRAEYIVEARKYANSIRDIILSFGDDTWNAREWLVKNIKGLGYKEASHFLRNVGYFDFAIIDRHILKMLYTHGFISRIPTTITKRKYFEFERIFKAIADYFDIPPGIFDFYVWYLSTGKILK